MDPILLAEGPWPALKAAALDIVGKITNETKMERLMSSPDHGTLYSVGIVGAVQFLAFVGFLWYSGVLSVGGRVDRLEVTVGELKTTVGQINQRFDTVNQRFDIVNQRFDALNQRLDTLILAFGVSQPRAVPAPALAEQKSN